MPSSSVFNTWANSRKETDEAVTRLAAMVRVCEKAVSGVDTEGLAYAKLALDSAEGAQTALQQFADKYGYV